jgi:hypothetical protein
MVKRDNSPAAVQSVDRALLVLEILAGMGQAGVTEIAEEICVHKIDGIDWVSRWHGWRGRAAPSWTWSRSARTSATS